MAFKVGCDIDCVLNNLVIRALEMYNERTGNTLMEDQITTYELSECLPEPDADYIKQLFREKELWTSLSPMPNAQMGVKRLIQDGFEVYLPTRTHYSNIAWKYEWLAKYYPFVPQENIIVIHNKSLLNVDVMIDDCLDNLLSGSYYRIVIDKPWNRNIRDDVYELIRVKNLAEARTIINQLWKNEGMAID